MPPTRRQLLASVPLAVALTGCLGDDDGADATPTPTPEETPTPTATPTPTPNPTPEPLLTSHNHPDHGTILVDADGMVLYMFDVDTQGAGASECYDDCETNWPPLVVDSEPTGDGSVTAELTTFERDDGSMQVAADGWPLYYFAGDEEPGDANGQGLNDVWWVLRPDGTVVDGSQEDQGGDNTPDGGGAGY